QMSFVLVVFVGAALLCPDSSSAVHPIQGKAKVHEVPAGDGLSINDSLTVNDPKDRIQQDSHHKVFLVKLTAGQNYVVRMNAADQDDLDAFLRIEDSGGKALAANDDAP